MTDPRDCPICGHHGTPELDDYYACLAGHRWPIEGAVSDAARRMAIALMIQRAGDAELAAIHDLLLAREAMPAGFDALVRVIKSHGTFEILPDRREPLGHARAAWRHGMRTRDAVDLTAGEWPRDVATGELHIAHEAGRAVIAVELVEGRR